jgi:hypothetical protein
MKPYAGLPILVLFGNYVDEFPRLAPRPANCRAFVAAATRRSCWCCPRSESRATPHVLMQDDNSLDIADILLDRIGKQAIAAP